MLRLLANRPARLVRVIQIRNFSWPQKCRFRTLRLRADAANALGIHRAESLHPRLLQLRRWRSVEHLAVRTLKQIKRIGFDDKRSAHPLEFRDTLDARKVICQRRPSSRTRLSDIEQFAGKQRRIRLGHVDPTDALRWLHHATAFRQREREPAGGAVARREHARSTDPNARRLNRSGKLAPSNADAANGGVAMIAGECAGVGLHDQYRKHQKPNRRRPPQAKIDYTPRAFLP